MRIILVGYGKMGKAIEEIAVSKDHEITLRVDMDNMHELNAENAAKADVAIEFTSPHSAYENVTKCLQLGIPVVCGSTGWLEHFDKATALCKEKNGTLIYSSNYSIGVNLFFELNTYLAKLMEGYDNYDVAMTEIHHTTKKDAPSGTAITLAEQILEKISRKSQWVNNASATPADLQILSERVDPAPGTHKISYTSPIDDIEIIHTAHNRKGFAGGAVLAAEFATTHKGVFGMKEVLGL